MAMLLTPPDPMSQVLMALPLVGLYELGIFLTRFRKPPADELDDEPDEDVPPAG